MAANRWSSQFMIGRVPWRLILLPLVRQGCGKMGFMSESAESESSS